MKQQLIKWLKTSAAWRNITLGILIVMFVVAGALGWAGDKAAQAPVFIVGFVLAVLTSLVFYKYMRQEHDEYERRRR